MAEEIEKLILLCKINFFIYFITLLNIVINSILKFTVNFIIINDLMKYF